MSIYKFTSEIPKNRIDLLILKRLKQTFLDDESNNKLNMNRFRLFEIELKKERIDGFEYVKDNAIRMLIGRKSDNNYITYRVAPYEDKKEIRQILIDENYMYRERKYNDMGDIW